MRYLLFCELFTKFRYRKLVYFLLKYIYIIYYNYVCFFNLFYRASASRAL